MVKQVYRCGTAGFFAVGQASTRIGPPESARAVARIPRQTSAKGIASQFTPESPIA